MAIAILGWGSLTPCPGDLSTKGDWHKDGPVLRIEFSRKSADGRLTLVIDTERGSEVTTQYAESTCVDLSAAIENLKRRESTATKYIGYCKRTGETQTRHQLALPAIREWLSHSGFDAVIWTDLESNFAQERNRMELLEAAVSYLESLSTICKENARRYINTAPPQTSTALRQHLEKQGWL